MNWFFFSWCKHLVILRDCCTEIYLFLSKLLTCSSRFYLSNFLFFVPPETCSTSQRSHTSFQSAQGKPCKLKRLFWTMAQMMTVKILTVWWCFQSKRTDVPELQTCHQNFFLIFFFLIKSLFLVFLFSTPWLKMWFHLWKSTGCTSSSSPTTRCLY